MVSPPSNTVPSTAGNNSRAAVEAAVGRSSTVYKQGSKADNTGSRIRTHSRTRNRDPIPQPLLLGGETARTAHGRQRVSRNTAKATAFALDNDIVNDSDACSKPHDQPV